MHSGMHIHTPAESSSALTHNLLMNRPTKPTNDRHIPNHHAIGT